MCAVAAGPRGAWGVPRPSVVDYVAMPGAHRRGDRRQSLEVDYPLSSSSKGGRDRNKVRVIQRRAYGLRDEQYLRLKVLSCMLPAL
jgi:hypothetical protein